MDEEELFAALAAADAAGEEDDARDIADMIKRNRAEADKNKEPDRYLMNDDGTVAGINPESVQSKGEMRDSVRGALASIQDGQLLGFQDEIVGRGRALLPDAAYDFGEGVSMEKQSHGDAYEMYRDDQRDVKKKFADENAGAALLLEGAGGFLTPGGIAQKGTGLLSRATRVGAGKGKEATQKAIARGMVEGGAAGAGYSEGENADEIANDMAISAGIGVGATGLLRALGSVAGKAANRRVAEDLVDETGRRKPLHLTDTPVGALYRTIGRIPGARGKLQELEKPYIAEAAEELADQGRALTIMGRDKRAIGNKGKEAARKIRDQAEGLAESAKQGGTKLARSRNERFGYRAAKESLPDGANAGLRGKGRIQDDARRVAEWYQNNGFQEVKDNVFDFDPKIGNRILERLENDADLRIAFGDEVMPKVQKMLKRLGVDDPAPPQMPGQEVAVRSPWGLQDLPPGQDLIPEDIIRSIMNSDKKIGGEALMAMRNVFASGANGSSKNGGSLRQIANVFDDIIREGLDEVDPALTKSFDEQIARYSTGLALQDAARGKEALKRGYITGDEWLSASSKYGGKGMSTKKQPLRAAGIVTANKAKEAVDKGRVAAAQAKKQQSDLAGSVTRRASKAQEGMADAMQDFQQRGGLAQARSKARELDAKILPKNTTVLSDMLSLDFAAGAVPDLGTKNSRAVSAARGYGVGSSLGSNAMQDTLAGQAAWQEKLRAAIMRGDTAAATRILSRMAASAPGER